MTASQGAEASAGALLGWGCLFQPGIRTPRASINLTAAWLGSEKNHLQYASTTVGSTVHLDIIEPSVSVHLDPNLDRDFLEVGFGAGALIFSGAAFESFTRVFVEPVRGDVRPFAFTGKNWGRAIIVRGSLLVVPSGFDATDFGAVPGSFHVARDIVPSAEISFDLLKAMGK